MSKERQTSKIESNETYHPRLVLSDALKDHLKENSGFTSIASNGLVFEPGQTERAQGVFGIMGNIKTAKAALDGDHNQTGFQTFITEVGIAGEEPRPLVGFGSHTRTEESLALAVNVLFNETNKVLEQVESPIRV